MNMYENLLYFSKDILAEKQTRYISITERHVQAIWFEQKYFKSLRTSTDLPIEIISPGIWNFESGPDFLKAHLKIDGIDYRGDIEIHLSDDGWYQHGHHQDSRYDNVILHLSLWKPSSFKFLSKKNGTYFPTTYLEPHLTLPLKKIINLIDFDLYPYKKFLGSGKCASTLFENISENEISSLLSSAAYWRLKQKKKFLAEHFDNISLQIAAGIVMALGYKNNAEQFLELFSYLMEYKDLPFESLLSIALGSCGFFDHLAKASWGQSDYYTQLKLEWIANKDKVLHQTNLKVDHIRPFNHPVRRLVILVKLLNDSKIDNLESELLNIWSLRSTNISELKAALERIIPDYTDSYWNYHFLFEAKEKEKFITLIGDNLKEVIVVNTIFPILEDLIQKKGCYDELKDFQQLYAGFRSPDSGKRKYLSHRFFGDSEKSKLLKIAQKEQGAFQIHKDFCIHYEASCEGCPFVERYKGLEMIKS